MADLSTAGYERTINSPVHVETDGRPNARGARQVMSIGMRSIRSRRQPLADAVPKTLVRIASRVVEAGSRRIDNDMEAGAAKK